jgi:hypothetical protein
LNLYQGDLFAKVLEYLFSCQFTEKNAMMLYNRIDFTSKCSFFSKFLEHLHQHPRTFLNLYQVDLFAKVLEYLVYCQFTEKNATPSVP